LRHEAAEILTAEISTAEIVTTVIFTPFISARLPHRLSTGSGLLRSPDPIAPRDGTAPSTTGKSYTSFGCADPRPQWRRQK
jgi:hypothetical protein